LNRLAIARYSSLTPFNRPTSRLAPVVFGEKNSMHSRFTDIEFSTNLQHQREKRCAGFHLHGKDLR
jgi:hypothetical protein